MAQSTLAQEPQVKIERTGDRVTAKLAGHWTSEHAETVELRARAAHAAIDAASS